MRSTEERRTREWKRRERDEGRQEIREEIELSLIIPCYNEEKALPISIPPLLATLKEARIEHEVIMVNNGSWDSTPSIIDSFTSQGYPVRRVNVLENQGYGWGILCGTKEARGQYIGYLGADGQIHADDVVRVWQEMRQAKRFTVVKGQRTNRADGISRRLPSWAFNSLLSLLFGKLSLDINGTPKFLFRDDLLLLHLESKCSFLDPELLIRAKALKFDIIEVPVTWYPRNGGVSTVRVFSKSIEFLKDIVKWKVKRGRNKGRQKEEDRK